MDRACEQYLRMWLAEIEAPVPDPVRAAQAARNLAACLGSFPHMQQLIQALRDEREDRISCETCQALLPGYIHAQFEFEREALQEQPKQDVRDHLALCPHCAAAYADVTEWLLLSQEDAIPAAESYPAFDLPSTGQESLAVSTTPFWSLDAVQRALAEGRAWAEDALGGIYLLFARGIQAQTAPGWALKSGEPGMLLAQMIVGEEEVEGWEIEASVFVDAENVDLCRIELAVYPVNDPDRVLAGLQVTLRYGETMKTETTDESGVIVFADIPRGELAQCAIRVTLPADSSPS